MKAMLRTVIRFFDSEEWPYEVFQSATPDRAKTIIRSTIQLEHGAYTCFTTVDDDNRVLRFVAYVYLCTIESQKVPTMVEFITRANVGISVGAFEFDFGEDPRVRFSIYMALADVDLTVRMVKRNILGALTEADEYVDGMLQIQLTTTSAIDAVSPIQQRLYGMGEPDVITSKKQ